MKTPVRHGPLAERNYRLTIEPRADEVQPEPFLRELREGRNAFRQLEPAPA